MLVIVTEAVDIRTVAESLSCSVKVAHEIVGHSDALVSAGSVFEIGDHLDVPEWARGYSDIPGHVPAHLHD